MKYSVVYLDTNDKTMVTNFPYTNAENKAEALKDVEELAFDLPDGKLFAIYDGIELKITKKLVPINGEKDDDTIEDKERAIGER